jgi:hypothetical protein
MVLVSFNGCFFGIKMAEDGVVRILDKVNRWVSFSTYTITLYGIGKGEFKEIPCDLPITL